jgi:hypothetical protein
LKTKEGSARKSAKRDQRGHKLLITWDLPARPGRGRRWRKGADGTEGKAVGVVHPRGDRKSAQGIEGKGDIELPLRKRVRNRMKTRGLYVCDRRERSWRE